MKTKLIFHSDLQQSLSKGVDKLADAVSITLGPSGANVIIKQKDKTILTKDGISVARAITLEDDAEQLGLSIIREASEKTANSAGDGTTTSIVLARAIFKSALKYAQTGINPILLKRAIDDVCEKVLAEIKTKRTFISSTEDIKKVAFISSNGDEFIASLVSQAVDAVGKHGSITFKETNQEKTTLELIEGFSFDSGLLSPQFITDERQMIARHQNPIVFITDFSISNLDFLMPVLELAAREEKPLIVIAEDVNSSALAGLISGHLQGNMPIACIRAPRFGSQRENILNDLALATGGKFITKNKVKDLKGISITDFGRAETIDISRWKTIIAGGRGNQDKIKQRIEILEGQLQKIEKIEEATENKERINRLGAGVAIIHVGGQTATERVEVTHRVEDALEAVKSALDEGILPGGGSTLAHASANLAQSWSGLTQEQIFAEKIMKEALVEPFKSILNNAGLSPDFALGSILDETNKGNYEIGFDVRSGSVCSLIEKGVIDPYKVVENVLRNATSSATALLTAYGAII